MSDIVSYVPQGMAEIKEFCSMVSKSNIVPKEYIGKPENVFVACIKGMDLGLKPLQALECIAVINGKTSLYGDAYLAIARGSGKLESYKEETTGVGDQMKSIVHVKRKGEEINVSEYTALDAKTAGLWGKSGPWALHPKRMLTMKARNYALRAAFADLFLGLEYSAEELMEVQEQNKNIVPRDITPIEPIIDRIRSSDKSLYKIDEKFISGVELHHTIVAKIGNIQSLDDLEQYEIWKLNNQVGIKEYCKVNKEECIIFAEDIKQVKRQLEAQDD